jgi:hypothetical protein
VPGQVAVGLLSAGPMSEASNTPSTGVYMCWSGLSRSNVPSNCERQVLEIGNSTEREQWAVSRPNCAVEFRQPLSCGGSVRVCIINWCIQVRVVQRRKTLVACQSWSTFTYTREGGKEKRPTRTERSAKRHHAPVNSRRKGRLWFLERWPWRPV